jgi:hypothetical protein
MSREPKFDTAYCRELDSAVSPYAARELYFNETTEYFGRKLIFACSDSLCRAPLVAVNIYTARRPKQALHFRTRPGCAHHEDCEYQPPIVAVPARLAPGREPWGYKHTRYPSEFLLHPAENSRHPGLRIEEREYLGEPAGRSKSSAAEGRNPRDSILRTSSLDAVVDCFLNAPEEDLKKHPLTIAGKTHYFRNWFKRIQYFEDAAGLIYWGPVDQMKKYGSDYRVRFANYLWENEQKLRIYIYIKGSTIDAYSKRRLFREQLDGFIGSNSEILCFFVGAYPQRTEVNYDNRTWEQYDVPIEQLDHLVFTFAK